MPDDLEPPEPRPEHGSGGADSLPPPAPAQIPLPAPPEPSGVEPAAPEVGSDLPALPATSVIREDDPWQSSLADRLATRNVPVASRHDEGVTPPGGSLTVTAQEPEFVVPELVSMGLPTAALLVGRALFVVAAIVVGIAARDSAGVGNSDDAEAFWQIAVAAGAFVVLGVLGVAYWATALAINARRLRARTSSPAAVGWSWLLVLAWVAVSSATYLRTTFDGDFDPLPGVAGLGFVVLTALAYGRVQGMIRRLSRRPAIVWYNAVPLDLAAFGIVWWRLTSWPDPVTIDDWSHIRTTSNIAFAAAAALTVNWLVFGWLAQRASSGVFERLGRLEARVRTEDNRPDWFASGLGAALTPPPDHTRKLIDTRPLIGVVALLHALWGLALVAMGVVLAQIAFDYSDRPSLIDGNLLLDEADDDRLRAVGVTVVLVYVITIVVHGVWSVLIAMSARRVTVHAPNPASFGVVFVPMPVLVVVGLLVGGDVGYWLAVVGLTLALFAVVRVNQMLMTLSSTLGGELRGFSTWSVLMVSIYLIGVFQNFVFAQGDNPIDFLAAATFLQGVLIVAGAAVGLKAMLGLERTLHGHRQTARISST